MTTPTPSATTYPPTPHPGPAPQHAPARSRWWAVAGVIALLLVVAGGVATVRWVRGGDDGPLAGRPRVTDTRAGLSYGVPEGWKHDAAQDKKLIGAFSSQIGNAPAAKSTETGGTVLAGRAGQAVPRAGLERATESAARSNAAFFFPDRPATLEESHATTLDGQPAHTAVLRIQGEQGSSRLKMTVVTIHGERTSFLLGLTTGAADRSVTEDVDAVLASATVD
ncbi:hypothetical protein L0F81_03465 [Streptomyces tricolor]|uniref:Secreted protein n=1 Tax=Streptomyces tricolor TaxID=68277 RepID=A0ABS9J9Y2_9ACTN|nr:hypothetical protein [Streptomyces tricolor]MCG0062354.1 hypothetical protein [Streptomyces tricolor]